MAGTGPRRRPGHRALRPGGTPLLPVLPDGGGPGPAFLRLAGPPLPRGRRVLLDLYGTNHHPSLWPQPELFRPERFADRRVDPFELIPQGGGEHWTGHRCAGEWITIDLMKRAVTNLTSTMRYDVPAQDLALDLHRMPALPPIGLTLSNIHRTA
ncbi:cytochrome P450 [Micromonospora sp. M12]